MFAQSTVTEPRSSSAGSVATAPLSGTVCSPPANMYSVYTARYFSQNAVLKVLCTVYTLSGTKGIVQSSRYYVHCTHCQELKVLCSPPGTMYSVHTVKY